MYGHIKSILSNAIRFHRRRRKQIRICNSRGEEGAFVIFRPAKLDPLHALMKKGFHHTSVMYCDAENKGCGIVLNMSLNKLAVEVKLYEDVLKEIRAVYKMGGCVLFGKIAPTKVINQRLPSFEPYNCVAITKRLLGIKHTYTWTPYQLYKVLVNKYNFRRICVGSDISPEQQQAMDDSEALTKQLQQKQDEENEKDQQQRIEGLHEEQGMGGFNMPGSGTNKLG